MKSKFYFALFFCLLSGFTQAQTFQALLDPNFVNREISGEGRKEGVKGDVFFQQEWAKGTITDHKGKQYEYMLCYHALLDNLYAKTTDGKVFLVNKSNVASFVLLIENNRFVFVKTRGYDRDLYAESLYDGGIKLFKRHHKAIERAGGYNEQPSERYVDRENLLIQLQGKDAVEIKASKKSLLAVFPLQAQSLEDFWKKEKMKVKNETDIIKTLKFLDTLAK